MSVLTKTNREIRYEYLRIISSLFILFNHINVSHDLSSISTMLPYETFNYFLLKFFQIGGKFGTNVFVIIGCYFLCDRKWNFRGIFRIIGQVVFFSIICNLVSMFVFKQHLSVYDFVHGFSYWFPISYIVMLLFIPILNWLLKIILNDRHKLYLALGIGGGVSIGLLVWGIVWNNNLFGFITREYIIGSLWFCYIYILVACLKRVGFFDSKKIKMIAVISCPISYILMYAIVLVTGISLFRDMYSPLCIFSALMLFVIFHQSNEQRFNKHGNVVLAFSKAALGMYLLQCGNNIHKLWQDVVFRYDAFFDSWLFLPVCILSVCVLVILATGLYFVYEKIVGIIRLIFKKE